MNVLAEIRFTYPKPMWSFHKINLGYKIVFSLLVEQADN